MSFIGKNIKKIRSLKKISQSEFAKIFDLTRGSIGAYEEGRAEPKIDTLVQLANYFGVSVDAFINKELTVADLYSLDLVKEKLNEAHHFGKEPELAYRKGGIGLVKLNNQLEYVVNLGNKDFINKLPYIEFPVNFKGTSRAFELNGSEMEYHQNGLHHGDILLCLQVDLKSKKPEKGKVYLLVVGGRIVTRRLKDVDDNKLYLMSDDPNYHDLEFSLEEIMQIWEVKGAYSTYLNPPKMLDEKVMLLETQMEEVLKKMKGMKK
ncbi:MAG: transcriptional regulator with XRE-family HTH domain [Cyclobacteriaceae bacterium]|jgi:transcriptional regulator with XRE-family HTH domain